MGGGSLEEDAQVHPSAIVEPGSLIGARSRIWHHAHIRTGAIIGLDCVIGKNVFVDAGVAIGDRVKIQNNVSVYKGVSLADDVFVGPSAVFTNDLFPRSSRSDWTVVPTQVAVGASIGANATIICGIEIGRWAMVGAGAVVTATVSPYELVAGNPARRLGWVCRCGAVLLKTSTDIAAPLRCENCGRTIPE